MYKIIKDNLSLRQIKKYIVDFLNFNILSYMKTIST